MNFVNRTHTHISIYTYTHLHIYIERENGFHKQFTEKRVKMVKLSFFGKNDACYQKCFIYTHSILGYIIIY